MTHFLPTSRAAHLIPPAAGRMLDRFRQHYRLGALSLILAAVAAAMVAVPLASLAMRPAPAGPATEIRSTVNAQVAAINSGNGAALAETYCAALQPEIRAIFAAHPLAQTVPAGAGLTVQSVTDVTVSGNTATALVRLSGSPTSALMTPRDGQLNAFVHESGGWKLCLLPTAAV
ncbi:Rv0361 family membrane protein [Jongsikchunia kroppenstedtii]